MRELLERSRVARVAVAAVAGCCVLALVNAAAARNDLDMREVFRVPEPQPAPVPAAPAPAPRAASLRTAPVRHASARPLRVAPQRAPHEIRSVAARSRPAPKVAAHAGPVGVRPLDIRMAALPPTRDLLFAPMPQKPAIVSIYADQTLRRGDAVMMRDGLHVFSGPETGAHRPAEFVQLAHALSLDWHLRKTLSAFEVNPPDRWRS